MPKWSTYNFKNKARIMRNHYKEKTGLPVMAGGLLTTPEHMEDIISNGRADMVYVGRELLRNPYFPNMAAMKLGVPASWPKQYERAF